MPPSAWNAATGEQDLPVVQESFVLVCIRAMRLLAAANVDAERRSGCAEGKCDDQEREEESLHEFGACNVEWKTGSEIGSAFARPLHSLGRGDNILPLACTRPKRFLDW
jgi:hypothetical protein